MGQRGPLPKNRALKLLGGNPGRRPLGEAVPSRGRVKRGRPDRPPELTDEAGREWDRVAADLDAAGALATADRGTLAAYCLAVADMLSARDTINAEGRFVKEVVQSASGKIVGERTREHAAVKVLDRSSHRVVKFAAALGLTPASRARLEPGGESVSPTANKVMDLRARIEAARKAEAV